MQKYLTTQDKFVAYACELARRDFWEFCKLRAPDFYVESRPHLKILCQTLQDLYEENLISPDGYVYKKLMVNMPPQHGKSRTLVNFVDWIFGKSMENRVIQCSFNDNVAGDFSRYVRDGIAETRNDDEIIYNDIFPDTKLKFGNKSVLKWALDGQHFNYIAAGAGGTITSKGGTMLLIDDPIKNAEIALNETALEKIWNWYTGTFLSRVAAKGGQPLEIIVMTRWSKDDICGRILNSKEAEQWHIVKMEAYNETTDEMLCYDLLNKDRYEELRSKMPDMIFRANYHQEPMDIKGALYKDLKTYDKPPQDDEGNILFEQIRNYTDTADEGSDYLCSACYGIYQKTAYLLDVVYTLDGMEVTEPLVAKQLMNTETNRARIESNAGGRGFARNVKRILREDLECSSVNIRWFHQSKNKRARILSNSTTVMSRVLFPANWKDLWPEFYRDVISYRKEGDNKNDDAPDTLTGIAEDISKKTMDFG